MTVNLIDVSGFIYRAFYALPKLTNKAGIEVGALYGFCSSMLSLVSKFDGAMFVAALDSAKKNFRHDIYKDYKANRKETPIELVAQIGVIKDACREFGFHIAEFPGYEADDVIASYATLLSKTQDVEVNVISSDKDLMQLMALERVRIYDPLKNKYITEEDVINKFGVIPEKILDVLSLTGDTSDNIPGVRGIGPKIASSLINEFGSLDSLINNLDKLKPGKKNEALKENIDDAKLSYELAKLDDSLDIDFKFERLTFGNLREFFEFQGFSSLAKKLSKFDEIVAQPKYEQKCEYDNNILFLDAEKPLDTLENKDKIEDTNLLKVLSAAKDFVKESLKKGIQPSCLFDLSIASYCINGPSKEPLGDLEDEYKSLSKILESDSKLKDLFELESNLVYVLAKMELEGILIDRAYLLELDQHYSKELVDLEDHIFKICGVQFNIASPKQVAETLCNKLGICSPKGAPIKSTDYDSLIEYADLHDGVTLKILHWRELSKFQNTYVRALLKAADSNDRVHTTFRQTFVSTGRLSSINPNLQNIPVRTEEGKKIRKAFIARDGYKIVSFDYSQIELRILAHIANCSKLIESFNAGLDIHSATAAQIFSVDLDSVTKNQRRIAKEVNFSIIYGMTIHTLSNRLSITYQDAAGIYNSFFRLYPEIISYIKDTERSALENGYVETLLGRRVFIHLRNNSNRFQIEFAKRQAINAPIQGTSADIIKKAMVEINEHLEQSDSSSKMILQIHDELLFEMKEDDSIMSEVSTIRQIMETQIKLKVPIVVDYKIGMSYGD